MGTKKTEQEVVGFEVQVIDLQDAQTLAMAGGGMYSALITNLLETIASLRSDQSFCFGMPKGKSIDDKTIKDVKQNVNTSFSKGNIPWKIFYSKAKKLFVATPSAKSQIKRTHRTSTETAELSEPLAKIKMTAHKLFKMNEFPVGKETAKYRAAIVRVAKEHGIPNAMVEDAFGWTRGNAWWSGNKADDRGLTQELKNALKGVI